MSTNTTTEQFAEWLIGYARDMMMPAPKSVARPQTDEELREWYTMNDSEAIMECYRWDEDNHATTWAPHRTPIGDWSVMRSDGLHLANEDGEMYRFSYGNTGADPETGFPEQAAKTIAALLNDNRIKAVELVWA